MDLSVGIHGLGYERVNPGVGTNIHHHARMPRQLHPELHGDPLTSARQPFPEQVVFDLVAIVHHAERLAGCLDLKLSEEVQVFVHGLGEP